MSEGKYEGEGRKFPIALRIAGALALFGYIGFLIGERVPLFSAASFADISVYLLFVVFVVGYLCFWKSEFIAGLVLIAWYGIQWMLVMWVWPDGGLTLLIGFPIACLGVVALVYAVIRHHR